jgi:large subunit ribosomal protein L25
MAFDIQAMKREGKVEIVREAGNIPAVLYGPHIDTVSMAIPYRVFAKLFEEANESTLFDITVDGGETMKALIQDVQFEPVKGGILHVDFRHVTMGEEMIATVTLVFNGVPPAEKQLGGTLLKSIESINVTCLPKDLVDHIDVDLTALATFDDALRVKNIVLPEGIVATDDPEMLIAKVNAPLTEDQVKAMEETTSTSVDDVEVEAKGKEDEEAAEGEEKKAETK